MMPNGLIIRYLKQQISLVIFLEFYIFSVFTSEPNSGLIDNYLEKMHLDLPNSKILLTGYQALQSTCQVPANIQLLMDFPSLIDLADHA